ncbi:hypothetical protein WOLCODRAFT_69258 [Wolfiporia cocos MD-104 SS10]|uniref:Uncharacterized protein n=1 Tax=Wolfiporia cocos (strain MD-104) TaxID=742152 RepID=A0A2H3JGD0_WOLCO|nr:hypothetical protein WOLCODRAFT_69258 [Wolfiporia cocos MD-104 SS10]
MPAHYAPLPNPHSDPLADRELEAAFDDSDDEDGRTHGFDYAAPGRRAARNGYHPLAHDDPSPAPSPSSPAPPPAPAHPAPYDFEWSDFDYARPPPGSPPSPTDRARPNEFGNSNGLVPEFASVPTDTGTARRRGGWFHRTAASVLPTHYVQRWGLVEEAPRGPVGAGTFNDGVFANVVAKPTRPMRVQEGDETQIVPEETQKDAPPSYAAAQADAVPSYWETTVHAPAAATAPGELVVDALPTGSLFSFLWNMLVSISFQFVGFLLTYLLHTTHAAKLGARAGLGITLIQYGFAMRRTEDEVYSGQQGSGWLSGTDDTWANGTANATPAPPPGDENGPFLLGNGAAEWVSFLLMTIGWFILLTSLLGFWRVKRWERNILHAQRENPAAGRPAGPADGAFIHAFERMFGLQGLADGSLIRTGLGLGPRRYEGEHDEDPLAHVFRAVEEDEEPAITSRGEYILPLDPEDPERNARMAAAMAVQARLHQDLRSAGLI